MGAETWEGLWRALTRRSDRRAKARPECADLGVSGGCTALTTHLGSRRTECIVYTWDYHSSLSVWNGLRTQPILSDEVQTFKALIVVHKLLQEGHPIVRQGAGDTAS